ncbi:cytochrome P450 [Auricularia subglabra TFB-10046 SS5]|uniref:Cytochrome P450 n=1 Tax=Auricularia subglabra (strain TFB-10046 / SS5) TaxID=717982 RepID=J0LIM5_AURST|nr:cytochrome P450 [Auricularia subglabra TFB-10046 SS5]
MNVDSVLDVGYRLAALAGVTLVALLTSAVVEELRRPRDLPPYPGGRRPLPFIGHRLLLPSVKSWITFRKWNEESPIVAFWNGSTPTILIGNGQIAVDLMEKRSQKYSSRPRFVVAGDLLTENRTILFAPYGEQWRGYRRALHLATMNKSVDSYKPIFEAEGKSLAVNLLNDPDDFYQLIYRYTASSVVAVAYGRRVKDTNTDVAYKRLQANLEFLIRINVPGAQWHETIPALKYLPASLNPIKCLALQFRQQGRANAAALVEEVRRKMALGIAPHSFARQMLEQRDKFPYLEDFEFNGTMGSLFGAGVDTTSATLHSLIMAMAVHPEAQRKVHEEMERVVGDARSPGWEDEEDLPYLRAVIIESMRWRPVAILGGTAHASTEDDVYEYGGKSYFIPKGSIILAPLWSIHMDPTVYGNPDAFIPERFLDGRAYPGAAQHNHSSFGWGRRVCPGAYFAERSLYLTSARLLWGFKFIATELIDTSMETGYTDGFNCRPRPFRCRIEPRNDEVRQTILREGAEAAEYLAPFEVSLDEPVKV